MSKETLRHLNTNVLVGFVEKRGQAWHYRKDLQGEEPNHYSGPIPIDDVKRRLFNWSALETTRLVGQFDEGVSVSLPGRKMLVRSDTRQVLGLHSTSYVVHQFDKWLLENVSVLLDDDLRIGSAGLLEDGKIAWVQVERPDNVVAAGVEFRPHILATSSHDGKHPTLYKTSYTIVVCDNTRSRALREDSPELRIKHSAKSLPRLLLARDQLRIHFSEDAINGFKREIEELMLIRVDDRQFDRFLSEWTPLEALKVASRKSPSDRSLKTIRVVKEQVQQLWRNDPRCEPFRRTAFGVLQTVNTWRQHIRPIQLNRDEIAAQYLDSILGVTERLDRQALEVLSSIVEWPSQAPIVTSRRLSQRPSVAEPGIRTSFAQLAQRGLVIPRVQIRG
jgi:phage/plasmid-like protein (TIGR03299 family)